MILNYIFPRTSQLTVFVGTFVLYAAIATSPDASAAVVEGAEECLRHWDKMLRECENFYETIGTLLGITLFVAIFAAYVLGPFFIPFTTKDLRGLCLGFLWIDLVLIICWHTSGVGELSWYQVVCVVYGGAWLAVSLLIARLDAGEAVKRFIAPGKPAPEHALAVGGSGTLLVVLLMVGFGWWWLDAYIAALIIVLIVQRLIIDLIHAFKNRDSESALY